MGHLTTKTPRGATRAATADAQQRSDSSRGTTSGADSAEPGHEPLP